MGRMTMRDQAILELEDNPNRKASEIADKIGCSASTVHVAAKQLGISLEWRTKKQAIVDEIQKDPFRTAREIAEAVGTTHEYVAEVSAANDAPYGRIVRKNVDLVRHIDTKNLEWLTLEACRSQTTISEFLNAIITDARLEDEE